MNTTDLNTTNEIHMMSVEDLGAVAGGKIVYEGGGGGTMAPSRPHRGVLDHVPGGVYGVGAAVLDTVLILAAFL